MENELEEFGQVRSLSQNSDDLMNKIINEDDPDKLEDLTNLFKVNQRKRDLARLNRLSGLLELVDSEVIMRVASEPEGIKDQDLINYMRTTQTAVSTIEQGLEQQPLIQINNQKNEININNTDSGLDRESRQRVLDAVRSILEGSKENIIDVEFEEEAEE